MIELLESEFNFFSSWFQNIILANRACGGGIVAWKGTNLTDAPANRYGAYIANSQIMRVSPYTYVSYHDHDLKST